MIPPLVHQMWIDPSGRSEKFEPAIAATVEAWRRLHPAFAFRMWSEDDFLALCRADGQLELIFAYGSCRFPSMRADLARLYILYRFGGFWIDLKLVPHGAFLDQLLGERLVLVEHFPKENLPDPNFFLVNGFIGVSVRHPCMRDALDTALRNIQDRLRGSIFVITGPIVLMDAVDRLLQADREGLVILRHFNVWGKLFTMIPARYNDGGLHWSEREARGELPYR